MIKEPMPPEEIAVLNVYTPNHTAAKYVKQKLVELKGEIHKPTIVVEDLFFSTSW